MEIDFSKAREESEAGYPHLEIECVHEATYGICIEWRCANIGFGSIYIWPGRDGKLHSDTERESDKLVPAIFREAIKQMVREDTRAYYGLMASVEKQSKAKSDM